MPAALKRKGATNHPHWELLDMVAQLSGEGCRARDIPVRVGALCFGVSLVTDVRRHVTEPDDRRVPEF